MCPYCDLLLCQDCGYCHNERCDDYMESFGECDDADDYVGVSV